MKLNPKIAEAARVTSQISDSANLRARRVLKAASENVPDEVLERSARSIFLMVNSIYVNCDALWENERRLRGQHWMDIARAALSAGLAKWAEDA
jgi:hypothetical protein